MRNIFRLNEGLPLVHSTVLQRLSPAMRCRGDDHGLGKGWLMEEAVEFNFEMFTFRCNQRHLLGHRLPTFLSQNIRVEVSCSAVRRKFLFFS